MSGVFGKTDADIKQLLEQREPGVAIVGFGYIGTVIGAVLADRGWRVVGIDVRDHIVAEINSGQTTVREPGLAELIETNVQASRLSATTDFAAVADNDLGIVTV